MTTPRSQAAVIINETVARKLWPGQDPIGRIAYAGGVEARVIGVVADVRESSVEGDPGWQMYLNGAAPQYGPEGAELVVRTKVPPNVLASSVLATLRQINHGQPATEFQPIQGLVDHAVSPRRFFVISGRYFCRAGFVAGVAGDLRRHLLLGYAADAGDWHSHGAGRVAMECAIRA